MATTVEQLKALNKMLRQLGFQPLPQSALNTVGSLSQTGTPTRLAVELRIAGIAIPRILSVPQTGEGEGAWNRDYRRAGLRWYGPTPYPDSLQKPRGTSIGAALRWVLQQPAFLNRWTDGLVSFTDWARTSEPFSPQSDLPGTDGRQVHLRLIRNRAAINRIAQWHPEFNSLAFFLDHRGKGLQGFRKLAKVFAANGDAGDRASRAQQARVSADTFRWRGPSDSDPWQEPILERLDSATLAEALPTAFRE